MSTNDELRALLAKATPGPWEVSAAICGQHHTETVSVYHVDTSKGCRHIHEVVEAGCKCGDDAISEANAALIVAAVNALPALLDRLDSLAGENERLGAALDDANAGWRDERRRASAAEAEVARLRELLEAETKEAHRMISLAARAGDFVLVPRKVYPQGENGPAYYVAKDIDAMLDEAPPRIRR